MKYLHTSILDTLAKYFSFNLAVQIADNVLEFGFEKIVILRYDLFDYLTDHFPKEKAEAIANEVVITLV